MDFFKAQEQARKKTRWLVFWFILAIIGVIALAYLAVRLCGHLYHTAEIDIFIVIGALCWLLIFAVIIYYWYKLVLFEQGILYYISRAILVILVLLFLYSLVLLALFVRENWESILDADNFSLWDGVYFFWTCLVVGGGIAAASILMIWEISHSDGTLIAAKLGGRMIVRNTQDLAEKRLLNVIDEMSIAAGIPAPVSFVLAEEPGLNAFAVGLSMQDSVIGITQGLLETMNRDELQGIIAHEISHIVNGDGHLNILRGVSCCHLTSAKSNAMNYALNSWTRIFPTCSRSLPTLDMRM
ncbi:MAG: M48 family metalloprotease [Betaproteobacteria bacterium]|nr:M48 family metalloprotease [Betaproteobacteria bacterium]